MSKTNTKAEASSKNTILHSIPESGSDAGCEHVVSADCPCKPDYDDTKRYPVYSHKMIDRLEDKWKLKFTTK